MKRELIDEKLQKIFYQCDKHIQRLNSAFSKMRPTMPLTKDSYINLSDNEVEHIDQFLFRFSKLQDAMGQKLFKTILLYIDEDIEGKPFIDVLNLMEKLSLIRDANIWRELRNDRNELAHNYEDEPELMAETINKLFNKKEILIDIYQGIKRYYLSITRS